MRFCLAIFSCAFAFLFSSVCFADEISLRSSENLNCILIRFSPYAAEIHSHGEKRSIDSNDIKAIRTEYPVKATLGTGENIIGLLTLNDEYVQIDSPRFGPVQVKRNELTSITSMLSEKELAQIQEPSSNQLHNEADNMRIGETPKAPPKDFLRGATVLRSQGEVEVSVTAAYERGRYTNEFIETMMAMKANETRYSFMLDFGATVGITDRLEGWLNVPVKYNLVERNEDVVQEKDKHFGIGDISGGLRYLAIGESENCPAVTLSFDVMAPTGKHPYLVKDPLGSAVATGNGNWAFRPGIGFVSTVDPVVLFYGFNYTFELPATHNGIRYKTGDSIGYYGGAGFAVNDSVSLSAKFFGTHRSDSKEDGRPIFGSSKDPFSLGFGVNYRLSSNLVVNPFVNIGANDDASDFVLGITWAKTL